MTAPLLLLKLAGHFELDLRAFAQGADARVLGELLEVFGDPVFDVAWAALPLFRGKHPDMASQLLPVDDFLDRYEQASDAPIDPGVFRFWTMFGHLRAVVPQLRAAKAFEEGATDLRLAAMGHQYLYVLRQLVEEWR